MKNAAFISLMVLCVAGGRVVAADATNAPSRSDYVFFRLIADRNIFNPNRSGRSGRTVTRETERKVKMETFTLVGTMSYEQGRFAFFDGSGSQYKKALRPAESIAGFKVTEVTPTCVKLEGTNGQAFELCVGMQMKKREEEDWQLAGQPAGSEVASSAGGKSDGGGEADEVLKRLMQRREQDGAAPVTEAAGAPVVAETKSTEGNKGAADESGGGEVLKKLLQKREQELNK